MMSSPSIATTASFRGDTPSMSRGVQKEEVPKKILKRKGDRDKKRRLRGSSSEDEGLSGLKLWKAKNTRKYTRNNEEAYDESTITRHGYKYSRCSIDCMSDDMYDKPAAIDSDIEELWDELDLWKKGKYNTNGYEIDCETEEQPEIRRVFVPVAGNDFVCLDLPIDDIKMDVDSD